MAESVCKTLRDNKELIGFFDLLGGGIFNRGIYRTLDYGEIDIFYERLCVSYPNYRERVCPFAFDWLNRMYCVDSERRAADHPLLLLFSLMSDEVLKIPFTLEDFHEKYLVESSCELFELGVFESFLAVNNLQMLPRDKCASLRVPLFLGEKFETENLEVKDVEFDWHVNSELLRETRALPEGTVIDRVQLT
ncbi:MAG TPA: hypothetical protein VFT37_15545 [Telluria sp.]|nr:hypothetical protein [Telluria sp.]